MVMVVMTALWRCRSHLLVIERRYRGMRLRGLGPSWLAYQPIEEKTRSCFLWILARIQFIFSVILYMD
jgi:hypothetical protein